MPEKILKAYQVGDNDIVAAYDEAGAIEVMCAKCGYVEEDFALDEVVLVRDEVLDVMQAYDQDEGKVVPLEKSLRQELSELTEPAHMVGWE
ncbi:hypothetical protein [Pseudomonas citronellolis]|uniref:hypothetical protein n=1 Tax=Pseudomonas citronellolis TaxID=53408 RepID=UPI0008529D28|nr:hypothetical protein [Pseudomonas humi]